MNKRRFVCFSLIALTGCFDGTGTGPVAPARAMPNAPRMDARGAGVPVVPPPGDPDAGVAPVPPAPSGADALAADAGTPPDAPAPADDGATPAALDAAAPDNAPPTPVGTTSLPMGPCGNDPSLALCIRFEGSFVDESPARLPVRGEPLRFVPARTGLAAQMSGQRRLVVPDHPSLDAPTITIEATVQPEQIDGTSMTVLEYPGQYGLVVLGSGSVMCVAGPSGYALKPGALQAGRWYDLVCVFHEGVISVFIDGVLAAQKAGAPLRTDPSSGIRIGWDDMPYRQFDGLIDELRVWRSARPPRAP